MTLNPQLRREIAQGRLETINLLTQINGSDPAAGLEVSQTVPAGKYWELIAVSVVLVQGLTQTPQPLLSIDDGADVIWEVYGSSAAQAVSTTCRYNWAAGAELTGQIGTGANVHSTSRLPDGLIIPAGYRIRTITPGIGANSDYGVPSFFVAQYG
jgi:hypothetical protein